MNLDEKDVDIPMDPDDHPEDALISNRRHPRGPSLNRGRQSRIPVTLHIFVLYAVIAGLVVVGLTLLNMPDTCHDPSQGIYCKSCLERKRPRGKRSLTAVGP